MKILTLSQNLDPVLRKMDRCIEMVIVIGILSFTLLVCCSCGSTKVATQLVRDVRVDTVYLSNVQYDSIYIYQERTSDYHMNPLNPLKPSETDTVFIKDVSVEYRYRLLRDTVYKTHIDSIPVIREVEVVREVPRPKTWFDRLCRYAFFLLCGALLFFVYRCIRKFI